MINIEITEKILIGTTNSTHQPHLKDIAIPIQEDDIMVVFRHTKKKDVIKVVVRCPVCDWFGNETIIKRSQKTKRSHCNWCNTPFNLTGWLSDFKWK